MERKKTDLLVATVAACVFITAASSPALSRCIKKNPIFGFDVYMADKYCQKKGVAKKARRKAPAMKKQKVAMAKASAPAPVGRPAPVADKGVQHVQVLLAKAGFHPGPADGVEGPATRRAMSNFKNSVGLPSSSSMSNTMLILERVASR